MPALAGGSSAAEITAYSLPGETQAATINSGAGTIGVNVQYGTNVTGLVATFTTSASITSITVGTIPVPQVSGTTANNFTSPVVYAVKAQDGSTIKDWTVTVYVLPKNPTAPVFGEAGRYVILASQAITTTGTTAISGGDLGIMDQARSYYAGFTPSEARAHLMSLQLGCHMHPMTLILRHFHILYTIQRQLLERHGQLPERC